MIASYDPGTKVAGVALWDDGQLCAAWLARGSGWRHTARVAFEGIGQLVPTSVLSTFVIEVPQVYTQRKLKGDPNDLINVALNAGAFATYAEIVQADVVTFRPHRWKGQVPKSVAIKRFQKRLTDEEKSCIVSAPKSLMHNVWDAIGIGLYYRGRR